MGKRPHPAAGEQKPKGPKQVQGKAYKGKQALSATQLRNARKRAAKKGGAGGDVGVAAAGSRVQKDPSLQYLAAPLKCPTVLAAKRFFQDVVEVEGELPVHLGPVKGWRTEAKLAVRAGPAGLQIGLFAPRSHDVCSVDDCPAHHPAVNRALVAIRSACAAAGVQGYDEKAGHGDLRYVKLDVQRSTEKVQLVLVWNAANEAEAGAPLKRLVKRLMRTPEAWYSIWANFNAAWKHASRIFEYEDSAWKFLEGQKKTLRESLSGCPVPYPAPQLCFPPNVFRQANLDAFGAIVAALRRFVPAGSRVVELYGGVGTIGLHLADLVSSLACSDENPNNARCFRLAAKTLPEELQGRLEYRRGDAAAQAGTIAEADVLIVDPPRKGLDDEVIRALLPAAGSRRPKRVLYVSCGFPALCRDLTRLREADWHVRHAEGFVLFPGADHVETFVVLRRKKAD